MVEDNEGFIEDDAIVLDDIDNDLSEDAQTENIVPFIMEKYRRAEDYRRQDEERWLRSYRNYRGIYGPDIQFTEAEKSRVFIKVTKIKVLAAYGQIVDVLFANNRFPLSIDPTELPDGVVADVTLILQSQSSCVIVTWIRMLAPMDLKAMVVKYLQVLQLKHLPIV